jgi:hypothetical protein
MIIIKLKISCRTLARRKGRLTCYVEIGPVRGRRGTAATPLRHGELTHGELRHGELKHGELKHGELTHGELKHGELKHGELDTENYLGASQSQSQHTAA